jgi:hypothetical protein
MLSDDDYLAPYFLSRCAGLLVNSTDRIRVIVALGDAVNLDTGWRNPARRSRVLQTGIQRGTEVLSEFLLDAITPQMCTVAIETESLRDSGGFPEGWHHFDDLVAWLPLLFEGDVGFVNESCGIQSAHSSSQTAGMALDTRLEEIDRLGRVLLAAGSTIGDRATAVGIARLTRRYVARNLLGHIGAERRNGGSRRTVASKAWRWRHRIVELSLADLRVTLRPIALLVAPLWFAGAIGTVTRRFTKRGQHSAVRSGSSSVASGMRS